MKGVCPLQLADKAEAAAATLDYLSPGVLERAAAAAAADDSGLALDNGGGGGGEPIIQYFPENGEIDAAT